MTTFRISKFGLRIFSMGLALGLLLSPLAVEAQQLENAPHAFVHFPRGCPPRIGRLEALRHGLRELGWIEGKNLVIELRLAESRRSCRRSLRRWFGRNSTSLSSQTLLRRWP